VVEYPVETMQAAEQSLQIVRGRTTIAILPKRIRELFDQFYAGFTGKHGLNIVLYPGGDWAGEFEIACGVHVESGGNASTPMGLVVKTIYFGPYNEMKPAHRAIHEWVRENDHLLAGPSWEVYGHWTDDPDKLRTDIYYLLER